MDRSTDRLIVAKEVFASAGLTFERVPAVDEKQMPADEIAALTTPSLPKYRKWDAGSLGCILSHVRAWEIAAQSREQYVAIFEDDNRLSPDLGSLLSDPTWIPADADIIRLETHLRPQPTSGGFPTRTGRRVLKLGEHFNTGSGAYIMSTAAAKRAAQKIKDDLLPSDRSLYDRKTSSVAASMTAYQLSPAPCIQDCFFTDKLFESNIIAARLDLSPFARIKRRLAKKLPKLRRYISGWQPIPFG